MRPLPVVLVLAACTSVAPPAREPASPVARRAASDAPGVDPIAALADSDDARVSWLVPGRIQLDLGGPALDDPGGTRPIEVSVFDRHGSLVRVAVRLDHARFSVWTERARLLSVLAFDHRVGSGPGDGALGEMHVVLRAGAQVRRLARQDGWTRVRYSGALEVEGWVADEALGESTARRGAGGRVPSGLRTLLTIRGAVIRTETRWSSRALAVMAEGQFLDIVREVDPAWTEVSYSDGDLSVRGFVSRQLPPGQVHRHVTPDLPALAPTAKVAGGTCLYTRVDGDPIGYLVGEQEVALEDVRPGWWQLSIATPWGPIAFAARGTAATDLAACGPGGAAP